MISRFYKLADQIQPEKITILYGPRRVGKTSLLHEYVNTLTKNPIIYTGEDLRIQEVMGSQSRDLILSFVHGKDHLIIDEAQHIQNV